MGRSGSGVRAISGSSIEITFAYRGVRCRERVRLKPTPANLKRAARHRAAVLDAIDGPLTMTACTHGDHECDQFSKCNVRDPLRRIRDRIAAILAECSILEIAADPEPSAPPVRVMSSPAMRRVSAL